MNNIDLLDFFARYEQDDYAIIKLPLGFPLYEHGSDIDIFCRDVGAFSRSVLGYLNRYVDGAYSIGLLKKENHCQVDLLHNKKVHFRFDLYGEAPKYKNTLIKTSFFDVVIESAQDKEFNAVSVRIPQIVDEAILRYIEYNEYFSQRPDKIKHASYIIEALENNLINKNDYYDRLHYFVALPEVEYKKKTLLDKVIEKIELIADLSSKFVGVWKNLGFVEAVKKVMLRLR